MTLPDYGKIGEAQLSEDSAEWATPFVASLRSRAFFLALFQEGLRAALENRRKGTRIIFYEWSPNIVERFDLRINGRRIGFERYIADENTKCVRVHREGFPPALVSLEEYTETVEPPNDWKQVLGLASEQITLAVQLLLSKLG